MTKDSISALMDGELGAQESGALLSSLRDDSDAVASWREYHLIREVLRGEKPHATGVQARVAGALADEPVVLAPRLRIDAPSVRWSLAAAAAIAGLTASLWIIGNPAGRATVTAGNDVAPHGQPVRLSNESVNNSRLGPDDSATVNDMQRYLDAHRDLNSFTGLQQVGFVNDDAGGRGESPSQ